MFQGKRLPNQTQRILPKNWHADISDSGWMTSDVFFKYISTIFYPWLQKEEINTPVLLFVDGHVSHRSLKLSEFCAEKKIILASLLPNTTHICQPMDVVIYGPVKRKWSQNLQHLKTQNTQPERMSKQTFCELLAQCVDDVCTPQLLRTAFEKTGLYPFNPQNFDYSKLPPHDNTVENENTDENVSSSNGNGVTLQFLRSLENLIESSLPGRLDEFRESGESWLGAPGAEDLFSVWKTAGGNHSQAGNSNELVGDADGSFELYDVVSSIGDSDEIQSRELVDDIQPSNDYVEMADKRGRWEY